MLAGEFDEALGLSTFERRHSLQELIQRVTCREMINKHLDRNPSPPETGRSGHTAGVHPDHLFQLSQQLCLHEPKLSQMDDPCKAAPDRPAGPFRYN